MACPDDTPRLGCCFGTRACALIVSYITRPALLTGGSTDTAYIFQRFQETFEGIKAICLAEADLTDEDLGNEIYVFVDGSTQNTTTNYNIVQAPWTQQSHSNFQQYRNHPYRAVLRPQPGQPPVDPFSRTYVIGGNDFAAPFWSIVFGKVRCYTNNGGGIRAKYVHSDAVLRLDTLDPRTTNVPTFCRSGLSDTLIKMDTRGIWIDGVHYPISFPNYEAMNIHAHNLGVAMLENGPATSPCPVG